MKHLLTIMLVLISVFANAQVRTFRDATTGLDTNKSFGTTQRNLYSTQVGSVTTVSIQYVGTKSSGTVGGSVALYSTIDGITWNKHTDSLTLADVSTNSKSWDIVGVLRQQHRVTITTSGAQELINKVTYIYK